LRLIPALELYFFPYLRAMKFEFKTDLIETRTINKRWVMAGFAAAGLLSLGVFDYVTDGKIGIIDSLLKLADMSDWAQMAYALIMALLALFVLPMLIQVFRKKRVAAGKVYFNEETIYIKDKGEVYEIPQEVLDEIRFDLKKLPEGQEFKPGKVEGGNFMTIPMGNKEHTYELQIDSADQKQDLLNMVEFLRINHDVKVKVKETDGKKR